MRSRYVHGILQINVANNGTALTAMEEDLCIRPIFQLKRRRILKRVEIPKEVINLALKL